MLSTWYIILSTVKKIFGILIFILPFTYVFWIFLFKNSPYFWIISLLFLGMVILKEIWIPNKIIPTFLIQIQLGFLIVSTALVALLNKDLLPYAYPIMISLSWALIFGCSLLKGPTIIEEFMKIKVDEITDKHRQYARKLTFIWFTFLSLNSFLSYLSNFYSMSYWMLYNGFISYVLIGGLIFGDIAYRYIKKC